jgi:hypothetical protein
VGTIFESQELQVESEVTASASAACHQPECQPLQFTSDSRSWARWLHAVVGLPTFGAIYTR